MDDRVAIAFANAKGGVGKTTSAVHVAGAIADRGVDTLLVDLDPQASATRHVGLDPESLSPTVTDVLIDPAGGLHPAAHATRYDHLGCVPAHESLGEMESELAGMPGRESLLAEAIDATEGRWRVIAIDVPPALSLYTVNALRAADAVVVPVQTHPFAFAAVPRTLELVDKVQRRLNPDLAVLGFLATMYDRRTRVARETLDRMEDEWDEMLFETTVPINVALAEAARDGRLLFEVDPDSAGATAYYSAGAEIVHRLNRARAGRRPTRAAG
ncbi:MAG: ParA family protein [Gemmatimonadota bacterium]|nr:ParA family protein [Gemmatimonadota bacterium]